MQTLRARVSKDTVITSFGHIGDGNLHVMVCSEQANEPGVKEKLASLVDPLIYEYVRDQDGSVSAEHGIGTEKIEFLEYSKSPEQVRVMSMMKSTLDPNGILNPYKVLPQKYF